MPRTNPATAVAGVAVLLAGGVIAIARGFGTIGSSPPALAGDLETLLRYSLEVAPVAVVLIVGVLFLRGIDFL